MNKIYTCLIVLLLMFFTPSYAQIYSGGSGTEIDPYLISSNADMIELADAVNNGNNYSQGKYFLLTEDLQGITTVIGDIGNTSPSSSLVYRYFQGYFDGGGHTINLSISENVYSGLFGCINGATIKNLTISGNANSLYSYGLSYAGGIVAYATSSTILSCINSAAVSSQTNMAGGICGYVAGSSISKCSNRGSISTTAHYSGSDTYHFVGGLCGYATGTNIKNCFNIGIVTIPDGQYQNAGGICGQSISTNIEKCYNNGNVSVETRHSGWPKYSGGICGQCDAGSVIKNSLQCGIAITGMNAGRIVGNTMSTISNCYSLATTTINESIISSFDPSSQNGKDGDAFSFQSQQWITDNLQWDFTNIWYIPMPTDYPLLKKQPNIHISRNTISYGETTIISSNNTSTPITYSLSDTTIATIQNNVITPLKVGTVTITATQISENEWTSTSKTIVLTINKKEVIVIANNTSMAYGDIPPTFTCQYSGFIDGETESILTTAPAINCAADPTSNVGTYSITPSGATAQNYSFIYQNGTLTIGKRVLNVIPDHVTKIYGNENPIFTFTYNGFVNGDSITAITTNFTTTTTATVTSPVGNYNITCSGGEATNYSFNYGAGILTVTKANLTAVADNKIRTYGTDNPTLTISYYGFKNSEDPNSLTQAPYAICQAIPTSETGNYSITLSGGDAQNYNFSLINGTLTINKAMVTLTALSTSAVYGDTPPVFQCQYSGFMNGETESVLTTLPVITSNASSTSHVGTYPIVPSGATAQNYSFTYQNGTLTIEKRPLNITPNDVSREYGSVNPLFTFAYSGFVNGDNSSIFTTNPIATTTANTNSEVGIYPINGSGATAINYNFIYGTGTLTVTKATLTAVADNKTRTYGTPNPTLTITYFGFKNSDDLSSLAQTPHAICQAIPTSETGDYPIVLSGVDDQNYTFSLINGVLTVNKATVTVTALSTSSVYGDHPVFQCQYSGFMNGETESVLTSLPAITSNGNSTSHVGTYPIVPSGATAQNYLFTYQNGTLTIEKRPLNITPNDASREYGDANPSFTFSYSGFVNGDDSSVITATPTVNTVANTNSQVGTYPISLSGAASQNYSFIYQNGILTITKAPLTITANNAMRNQGEPNPIFTLSYSGFKNDENYLVLDMLPIATCIANESSITGLYEISLTGGNDNNYDYILVNGTLQVVGTTDTEDNLSIDLKIYPNPVCNQLYIQSEKKIKKIAIFDITGKLVVNEEFPEQSINVMNLMQGVYLVNVFIDNQVITKKIIKK